MRLTDLIAGIEPGKPPINLSVGEPQHPIPSFVGPELAAHLDEFGRYPANKGTEAFRRAVAALARPPLQIGACRSIRNPKCWCSAGTREALFLAAIAAKRWVARAGKSGNPAILIPNPFYAAYSAGCDRRRLRTGLSAGDARKRLSARPRSARRNAAQTHRRVLLASPSNPQGAVANRAYLDRLAALARRFGFLVFADECYCEIYSKHAPAGMLEAAGPDFANTVVFHSLSKRSSLPGLRVGFAAGDRRFLSAFLELRNVAAPQVPAPAQYVAVAAYGDEAHVRENRKLYSAKFDLADQIIGDRYGYRRPAGGFFLWLDVSQFGGSEAVTKRLWAEAGVRVVPGRYLARNQADGSNPGADYIRVAMVQDSAATAEALHRLVAVLS